MPIENWRFKSLTKHDAISYCIKINANNKVVLILSITKLLFCPVSTLLKTTEINGQGWMLIICQSLSMRVKCLHYRQKTTTRRHFTHMLPDWHHTWEQPVDVKHNQGQQATPVLESFSICIWDIKSFTLSQQKSEFCISILWSWYPKK